MDNPEEVTIKPSTELSRIYKTDPYGFPLYHFDEEDYILSKKEKGLNPDAISETTPTDSDDGEQSNTYDSLLNL